MSGPRRLDLPVVGPAPAVPQGSDAVPESAAPSTARLGQDLGADPARIADGWEHRFVAVGERIAEVVALYRELGFEVVADPVPGEGLEDGCLGCFSGRLESRVIYTRRRSPPDRNDGP